MKYMQLQNGTLEVICGPMFCGKTEELLRRIRRAMIAKQKIQIFTHSLDTRYHKKEISSHNGLSVDADTAKDPREILAKLKPGTEIMAIDEAQFFGSGLVPVVHELLARGIRTIVAGLAVTREGEPFEPLPQLMAEAENVTKLTAICAECGKEAAFHMRTIRTPRGAKKLDPVFVGGTESYRAFCRSCFTKKKKVI
jgi:thymidine kinase